MFNTPNRMSVGGYLKMGWTLVTRSRTTIKICSYPRFALKFAGSRLLRHGASEESTSPGRRWIRERISVGQACRAG